MAWVSTMPTRWSTRQPSARPTRTKRSRQCPHADPEKHRLREVAMCDGPSISLNWPQSWSTTPHVYPDASHGTCVINADHINADLLAFLNSQAAMSVTRQQFI